MAIINGTNGADDLDGTSGDDTINGLDGNDILDGKLGKDTMSGGKGDDAYYVDDAGDTVVEFFGEGWDWVYTTRGFYVLPANVDAGHYVGVTNVTMNGNAAANLLVGGAQGDTLDGKGGADTMIGLGDNDVYFVDHVGDVVVEEAGGGANDAIYTSLAYYQLPANVEVLAFVLDSGSITSIGNALNNGMLGGPGHDSLDGGAGTDTLIGGGGDDTYWTDDQFDNVVESSLGGYDRVFTTAILFNLNNDIEELHFIGSGNFTAAGNDGDNLMVGGSGNDSLSGFGGDDTMIGKAGNDIYQVTEAGDQVIEADGEGIDTVKTNLLVYTLPDHVERLEYLGISDFTGFGNDGANELTRDTGDDILNGLGGADLMQGGTGDDTYWVDDVGDQVVEGLSAGFDTVRTTLASYTLGLNLEGLIFAGSAGTDFTGIGNSLANELVGGGGNDSLDGGAGADKLVGGAGNDIYFVDNANDQVVEYLYGGIDEVRTANGSTSDFNAIYYLPGNIENLTGTSAGAQGVGGNALDNYIAMGGGSDLIVVSQGGVDTVHGGAGNDFVHFGDALTAADTANGGVGFDTLGLLGGTTLTFAATTMTNFEKLAVYTGAPDGSPNSYDLTVHDFNVASGQQLMVVALSLHQSESLAFNGSAETNGSFNIRGGKGADTLTGGAKNDQIYGNLGADILAGGAGNDVFDYFSAAESTAAERDTILSFAAGDKINLAAIDADGNAGNGNSAFAFIGNAAFSGTAGQLRAQAVKGGWLVEADVNGDGLADLVIDLTTPQGHTMTAADFFL